MKELFTPAELSDIVDTLADIRAQIADLTDKADTYKSMLVAAGHPAIDGTQHRATISETYPTRTDWRAVAEQLSPPAQLIAAHTTTAETPTFTLRLTARKVSK
jgi:hypothetical protein